MTRRTWLRHRRRLLRAIDGLRADVVKLDDPQLTNRERSAEAVDLVFNRFLLRDGVDRASQLSFRTGELAVAALKLQKGLHRIAGKPIAHEPVTTPEETLRDAGIDDEQQATYQRRFSALLAGRGPDPAPTRRARKLGHRA